jgi:hypothetical protein
MTKEELIVKQQLLIEEYEQKLINNGKIQDQLINKFYGIGQPLNDNNLLFNDAQLKWCISVMKIAESINVINK